MRYGRKEIERIKKSIPRTAFKLFARSGIEPVTMQNVADECNIGVATLYRYYGTKKNLVVDTVATRWTEFNKVINKKYIEAGGEKMNMKDGLEFFMDSFILLFEKDKSLLKLNMNFDIYAIHEKLSTADLQPYYNSMKPFLDRFSCALDKMPNGSGIPKGMTKEELFYGISYSMLSIGAKYAYGAIYPKKMNYLEQLNLQKKMYVDFYSSMFEKKSR